MPFKTLISQEARARIDFTQREMARLYGLSDLWLGAALLRLARQARQAMPKLLGDSCQPVYDATFVWHLVPNIAKRLGASSLQFNENRREDIILSEGQEFRELVGSYLKNLSMGWCQREHPIDRPTACEILGHDLANGNPVAMAIDRLVPAPVDERGRSDWIARHLREISAIRGFEATPHWSPKLQGKSQRVAGSGLSL